MGAKFLRVAEDADGSGVGGYAKEMSDDYKSKEAYIYIYIYIG